MDAIQTKYKMIYCMLGGDESSAPNLEVSEIRLPMISLLKRQILKLGGVLHHANDYVVQRNFYGNYSVGVSPDLCCCSSGPDGEITPLAESDIWQGISAL